MISAEKIVQQMIQPLEEMYFRMEAKLSDGNEAASPPGPFIFHRNQWIGFVVACSSIVGEIKSELKTMLEPVVAVLGAVFSVIKEGEKSFEECVAPTNRGFIRRVFSFPNGQPDERLWIVKNALRHTLSYEVPHRHMDDLRTTSLAVHEALSRESAYVPWGNPYFSPLIYKADNVEASRFFRYDEIGKIENSQLVLRKIEDILGVENPEAVIASAESPNKVDPVQFQKIDRMEDLGSGISGTVKLRSWIRDDHHVAIKNCNKTSNESRIQGMVRHPNLLPLLCRTWKREEENEDSLRLVMERMDSDLKELIRNAYDTSLQSGDAGQPFPLPVSVEIMLQIAKGMEYLHHNGIMHRDLKPANILVSGYSTSDDAPHLLRVKVADFGAAKENFQTANPSNSYRLGTTYYRAPEVMHEDPNARYNRKADVYSFAMVCYHILSGKEAFDGDTRPAAVLRQEIRNRNLRPSFEFESQFMTCPPALSGMVSACWHHDASRRPDFTQIAAFLRFVKVCALRLVSSSGSHRGSDSHSDLVNILQKDDLFHRFCNSDLSISSSTNSPTDGLPFVGHRIVPLFQFFQNACRSSAIQPAGIHEFIAGSSETAETARSRVRFLRKWGCACMIVKYEEEVHWCFH